MVGCVRLIDPPLHGFDQRADQDPFLVSVTLQRAFIQIRIDPGRRIAHVRIWSLGKSCPLDKGLDSSEMIAVVATYARQRSPNLRSFGTTSR